MYYKIAHSIVDTKYNSEYLEKNKYLFSLLVSSKGKILSGAEINPCAKIGKRFVLDHGVGTVIGETSEIGNDCYILGWVILGARGIANNHSEKRHPQIGNNVQIGSFAKILGNIQIGNDVFIGANCIITENLPDNSIVTLKTEKLIIKN